MALHIHIVHSPAHSTVLAHHIAQRSCSTGRCRHGLIYLTPGSCSTRVAEKLLATRPVKVAPRRTRRAPELSNSCRALASGAKTWPTLDRHWSTIGQTWLEFVKFDLTRLTHFDCWSKPPDVGETGQDLVSSRPDFAETRLHILADATPNIVSVWPNLVYPPSLVELLRPIG